MTADGLVAVLGWSLDDFEEAARRADRFVLEEARKTLFPVNLGESDRERRLATHGVRFIDDLLAGRDGKYWERMGGPT